LPAIESWKRQRDELQELLNDYLSGARHKHDFSTPASVSTSPRSASRDLRSRSPLWISKSRRLGISLGYHDEERICADRLREEMLAASPVKSHRKSALT
jgi:hypothetical protein